MSLYRRCWSHHFAKNVPRTNKIPSSKAHFDHIGAHSKVKCHYIGDVGVNPWNIGRLWISVSKFFHGHFMFHLIFFTRAISFWIIASSTVTYSICCCPTGSLMWTWWAICAYPFYFEEFSQRSPTKKPDEGRFFCWAERFYRWRLRKKCPPDKKSSQ